LGSGETDQGNLEGHARVRSLTHLHERLAYGLEGAGDRSRPQPPADFTYSLLLLVR
jgi:hypothetical protein